MRLKQCIFALVAMLLCAFSANAQESVVAKIGNVEYTTFASAMADANAATGNVTVEVYGAVEFVDGMELAGSYSTITFTGKSTEAKITINQTAGGDYLEAHGKTVAFNGLILAKANPAWSGNSGHMGNYFSIQGGTVTYTDCTFPNGACTNTGTAVYNNCTFENASEYGLWVYDDALVTVNGGTIDSKKGIKVYSEGEQDVTSTLTVQNATFTENVTAKPAVAVGYAESITLIGNTYNNPTAHIELDSGSDADCEGIAFVAQDTNGNDISSELTVVDRSNGSAACGVLVDGEIYTTVTTAAAEATSGSTVTLLYNSTEDVELPEGVALNKNGFTADNVTVATSGVAQVGENVFTTVLEALQYAIDNNAAELKILCDVREKMTIDFDLNINADLTITADAPVKVEFYNDGTAYDFAVGSTNNNTLTIGENVHFDLVDRVIWLGYWGNNVTVVVNGYLGGYQIWHGANTVVNGTLDSHGEAFVMRRDATLTANEGAKVNANYFQIYSGHIVAENATITAGLVWVNNNHSYGNEGTVSFELDNTEFTSNGEVKIYAGEGKIVSVTLENSSLFDAKGVVTLGDNVKVVADATSSIQDANGSVVIPVAKIGDVEYASLAEAVAAAQASDEIVLLSDVAEDATLPAGVKFNGNGKAVGNLIAGGEITFTGVTKATSFGVQYTNTTVNIVPGACLEITGSGRMVIGHGCTFNITGSIENAKTADVAALTPSLIMPGASFTGAGVTFNVTNAYIKTTASYCSSSSSASGTFDFNIENSIWEQFGKLAFESQSVNATVNFDLKNSVLNTTSHLVFGVSRGEVVIDNSNVNVGTSRQIENQSTMTIKNGAVVNGAVATSSNAKNPGTIIVDNATYAVTGEFSGSDLGTGTLIVKKGATVSAGSITKANIQIDATGMAAGDEVNLTADLSKLAGTIEVVNNNLDASIVDGKIVLAVKPVAKIGETTYATLEEAISAAKAGDVVTVFEGTYAVPAMKAGITIVGEGNVLFEGTLSGTLENLTMKNIHIKGGNAQRWAYAKGNLLFENVTFEATSVYALHFDGITEGTTLLYKDCTIIGWAAMSGSPASCVFDGCTIKDNGTYGVIRTYFDATIENCTFDVANANTSDVYQDGIHAVSGAEITVNDCTNVNGEMKDLVNVSDASVVSVDGVEIKNVAQIGDKYYASLAEAVAAAESGATITLMNGEHELPLFAGKELTFKGESKDGVIVNDAPAATTQGWNGSTFHFENLTAKGATENYHGLANGVVTVTYKDCNINGLRFLYASEGVTFEDCAFNAQGVEHSFWTYGASNVTVKNSTFTYTDRAVNCYSENGENHETDITFEGCSFTYAGTADAPEGAVEINSGSVKSFDVAFNNCTAPEKGAMWFNSQWDSKQGENTVVSVDGEIVWQVTPAVAKIGDVEYATLAEAVAAVEDGGTITMIANETFTENNRYNNGGWWDGLGYSGDKSFTIDLNNFTISQDGALNDYLMWFKNDGAKDNTITLKNGTLDAGTTAYCALATASSNAKKITVNLENISLINNNSNGSTVKVRGGAVLNVKDGTVITGKDSYLGVECSAATVNIYDGAEIYMNGTSSYNGCLAGAGGNGTINVYGGYGKGAKGGFIAMTSGGTINIEGGEWIANTDGSIGNNSNVYVLTAQSNINEQGFVGPAIINVTGGTFRGGMDAWVLNNHKDEKAELNISGGNFNADPATYLAQNYVAVENNGVWNVELAAAKIGENAYATLEEAFADAAEGETITLLADATPALTSQRAITKAAVIDLGGNTLTLTEDDLYFGTTTFKNGTIVVDPSVKPSTAVFWMFANQTLTFDAVKVVATGVTGTYLIGLDGNNSDLNLLNGSEILIENTTALDLDVICVNASTGNDIVVENSKVNVTNLDGRVFFRGNYTVKDSEVSLAGITKAGFRIEAGQTLSIEGTSIVTVEGEPRDGGIHITDATATYTKAETATVNATVNAPAPAYVAQVGDAQFETLSEAVAAAQAGQTVTLLADVETADGIVITDKNLVIDLNDKTYTTTEGASTNNRNFKIEGTSVVTIKNGTMVAAGDYSSGAYGTVRTEGSANVTLEGLKLYNYRGNGLNIKACAGTTVTVKDTEIYANYGGGIESAGGTIVVDNVTVEQKGMYTAPYNSMAISVNGGGKVTVNSGTYSTECITAEEANNQGTSHGPWVAGVLNSGGTLIINGGTFSNDNFGENSLATYARGAILADTKAKVEINGGKFNVLKNVIDIQNNLGDANNNPSVVLAGGTYNADPSISASYGSNLITLADGYAALPDLNGNYVVGVKPTATVNNLGMTTIAAGDYSIWNGSFDQNTEDDGDMPLSFVMQFLADQDAEDMDESPFADWYGDFVITFTGIENGSFTADGCYLAGHYGSFGWVKVPVDGMTIEEDARYPVMLGVGLGQKYDYICSSVEDFKCALYLTPEILEANPNIQVKLELAVVDNSKGSDAAASALVNNENVYSVTEYTYDAEDFVAPKDPEVVDGKIEFVDGEFNSYTNDTDIENVEITYKRTIDSDWNALYVPFEIPASELLADFDIAYINDVRETDADDDGELDGWQMELIKIKNETAVLRANHPYFIRSKSADYTENNLSLTLTTTLYKATVAEVKCSSMYSFYTIKGLNELRASTEFGDADRVLGYDNGETTWGKMADGYSLKPFRFYLTITNIDGSPVVSSSAQMSIVVRGEDGTTGIDGIYGDENGETVIFDLYGRRVLEPEKGNIYIINGKKVIY